MRLRVLDHYEALPGRTDADEDMLLPLNRCGVAFLDDRTLSGSDCPGDGSALFPQQEAPVSAPVAVAPRPRDDEDLMEALLRRDTAAAADFSPVSWSMADSLMDQVYAVGRDDQGRAPREGRPSALRHLVLW